VNIEEDIKIRRLGWVGHIIRMEEGRIPKRVLTETSIPQNQWEDQELDGRNVIQRDALQLLGIRGWRSKAANRDEWRRLMREVKARKGL
jgi:hypothetical protein